MRSAVSTHIILALALPLQAFTAPTQVSNHPNSLDLAENLSNTPQKNELVVISSHTLDLGKFQSHPSE